MTDIPHNPALEWGTDYRGPAFASIRQVLITAKECLSHEEAANRLLEADRKTGSGGGKNNMVEITKRALPDSEYVLDRCKRAKLVTNAPSTVGKPDFYESLQRDPSEKIFDDRPEPDPNIPSVALLYEGFGHFLDIMDGRNDVPGLPDIDITKLHREVDNFASEMNEYYDNEIGRRDAALSSLTSIFSARRGIEIPPLQADVISTNGHNIATHDASTMAVEIKDKITGINAIPQVELAGYVAHLNAMRKNAHPQLYLRWRVPCLGLTVVGCQLTFYAIVPIGHQFKLVSLTPTFSCIQSASDGRDRTSLYSAFTAASVLQAHILQDLEKLLNNLPSGPILGYEDCFPAVSKLRKYPASSDDYFSFEIRGFFRDRQLNDLLYRAETPNKQPVLVKFAQRYSIELHEFCAKLGHAPRIFAFERLPGGWCAVAMEYVESGTPIACSTLLAAHRDRWTEELQCLMNKFHMEGLVHGDLRAVNILCSEDSMWLTDFDWGGKSGEVFYATANLNYELLEDRVSNDLRITQEDDRRVLGKTLAKLNVV